MISALSERGALAAAAAKLSSLDISLSLAVEHPKGIEEAVSAAWNALILSRSLVFDGITARNRLVAEISNPEVAVLAEALSSARQQLANIIVRGPKRGVPEEDYLNLLDKARSEKEQAERMLAEASTSFREKMEENRTGLIEVQESLPPGFALLAFARYSHYESPLKNVGQDTKENIPAYEPKQVSSYLAFVLSPQKESPMVIHLGKTEEIEPLIFAWGQEAARGARIPGRSIKESEAACFAAGEALRRIVWDPIAPYLKEAKCVFIVPDGDLHTVNFAALPVAPREYLIESGPLIHYLTTERELVSSSNLAAKGMGLLALGDPVFDETSFFAAFSPENKTKEGFLSKAKPFLSFRGVRSSCGDFKSLKFSPLPATNKEIKTIVGILKRSKKIEGEFLKLTGEMASERAFKMTAPGKQILHLATHGFFLDGECPSALMHSERQRESYWEELGNLPPIRGENPLLLTGLALAGANYREAAGAEEEDGILTAEEVASLDLSGVKLVVLSACDTGIGKIRAGEGVFGLRRAFRVAGAQTLITSLWAVEDEATRKWMSAFYNALFSKDLRAADSAREASLEMLQELRKKRKGTHPFYWAGFVASGNWD
jgi:CHAT domain-containing protein